MVAAGWQYRGPCGSKALSLNLNFRFRNQISLLLISSSYPIALTRMGGPRSRPYTSRKISRVQPGVEPGTSWMAVRCANHYTKLAVTKLLYLKINCPLTTSERGWTPPPPPEPNSRYATDLIKHIKHFLTINFDFNMNIIGEWFGKCIKKQNIKI